MEKKKNILVCYATRYGSTKAVAEIISEQLSEMGFEVKLKNFNDDIDLSGVGIVFAGSPLHLGKWLPEAKEFMQFKKSELNKIPVITFTTGITLSEPTEHNMIKAKFAIDEVSVSVVPFESGFFAGRLSKEVLSETDMQLVKLAGIKDGDYIDTDRIKKWVIQTCNNLRQKGEHRN